MSTPTQQRPPQHRTYGNWVRPRSPGVFGLGTIGSVILIATPAVAVLVMMFSGDSLAGLVVGVVGLLILVPISLRISGRSLGELAFVRLAFWRSARRNENAYLSGSLVQAYGHHRLPGILARSELTETQDGFGTPAAIVVIPQTGHYTAVLRLDPEGASLVDREQIDQWVAGYGSWLAQLAHEPGAIAASVSVETAPDPGTRLAASIASQQDPCAPTLAKSVLDRISATYPAGSAQVTAWATVTYRSAGSRKRSGREAMITHVASRLPILADLLRTTGAGAVRPMSAQETSDIVTSAYDPDLALAIEQHRIQGTTAEIGWSDVGPKADIAGWDYYRHDSGVSRVWSMEEAPRGTVLARVLEHLLAPHPQIPRKRVTLLYRPHAPGDAANIVDRDLRTAEFVRDARRQVARESVAVRAAAQATTEEAEGAGLTRFSLLVAVTVEDKADLDDADTIIDGLQGTARLRLRPVYGGQRAAFAAGLPTGIVLPEHVVIPTDLRTAL